jgi:hypothetical protein
MPGDLFQSIGNGSHFDVTKPFKERSGVARRGGILANIGTRWRCKNSERHE